MAELLHVGGTIPPRADDRPLIDEGWVLVEGNSTTGGSGTPSAENRGERIDSSDMARPR